MEERNAKEAEEEKEAAARAAVGIAREEPASEDPLAQRGVSSQIQLLPRSTARDKLRSVSRQQQRTVSKQTKLASILQADAETADPAPQLPPVLSFVFSVARGTALEGVVKQAASDHFTDASVEARVTRAIRLLPLRTAIAIWRGELRERRERLENFRKASAEGVHAWRLQFRLRPAVAQWNASARKSKLLATAATFWSESSNSALIPMGNVSSAPTAAAASSAVDPSSQAPREFMGRAPRGGGGMRNSLRRAALYELREHADHLHAHKDLARYVIARMDPKGRATSRALLRWLDFCVERLDYLSTLRAAAVMLSMDLRNVRRAVLTWIEMATERRQLEDKINSSLKKQSVERRSESLTCSCTLCACMHACTLVSRPSHARLSHAPQRYSTASGRFHLECNAL